MIHSVDLKIEQLPVEALSEEEKSVSLVFLLFKVNTTAPSHAELSVHFNCIDSMASEYLDSLWASTNTTTTDEQGNEFTTVHFEQRVTITELYNCFGEKYESLLDLNGPHNDLTKSYLGGAITVTAKSTLNNTVATVSETNEFQNSTELYSEPVYFVVATTALGKTTLDYSVSGLGFAITSTHQKFFAVGEFSMVIRTCINKPSNYDVILLHESISSALETVTFNYVAGSSDCIMLNGKCCQFWRYETSGTEQIDTINTAVNMKWTIQSLSPNHDGKVVESSLNLNAQRSTEMLEQDTGTSFNLTVLVRSDPAMTQEATSFMHGTRIYIVAGLTPLSPFRCNLFGLSVEMVRQCVKSSESSASQSLESEDIPPTSCDGEDVDTYVIYDKQANAKPMIWGYEELDGSTVSGFPPCESIRYLSWYSRMLKTRSRNTAYLTEITWRYYYNDLFDHANGGNNGGGGPPDRGLMKSQAFLKKHLSSSSKTFKTRHQHLTRQSFDGDIVKRRNFVHHTVSCPPHTIYDAIQHECVELRRSVVAISTMGVFGFCLLLLLILVVIKCVTANNSKLTDSLPQPMYDRNRYKKRNKSSFY